MNVLLQPFHPFEEIFQPTASFSSLKRNIVLVDSFLSCFKCGYHPVTSSKEQCLSKLCLCVFILASFSEKPSFKIQQIDVAIVKISYYQHRCCFFENSAHSAPNRVTGNCKYFCIRKHSSFTLLWPIPGSSNSSKHYSACYFWSFAFTPCFLHLLDHSLWLISV